MTAHTASAHRRAERPPLRQPLLVLLIAVTVSGAACLWGVYAAPVSFRVPLAWGIGAGALLLCAAAPYAAYQRLAAQQARRLLHGRDAEAAELADRTVPALVERLREGDSADTALANSPDPGHPAYRTVMAQLAEEVGRGEAGRAAATAACANAAGRMQALATSMLADLREMEHRHASEDVLGDLLHLDHRTAQAGRIADSIAVLTGARSGRRWAKPIVMESILRGAMGRIAGYQRVRLHSTSAVAVAGHAAEGVMHALAELLDNATSFSPPTAEVHVYVEEVPAGVVITVEDSGLVMGDVALRRAQRAVSAEPLDLTTLSGTRLGLAVVGCLARKHGLSVSFRPSARGGTGALMMIPQELVSRPQDNAPAPERQEPSRRGSLQHDTARQLPNRRSGVRETPADERRERPVAQPAAPRHAAPPPP
uniref:sensor histidine kinase n=3 Tax=Streptomyces TaxID=1883 RepID=UPI001031C190